jgi:hypothetical protein
MIDLSSYFPVLVASVFVASVVGVVLAVRHSEDPRVRKSFVAIFFVGLLTVNVYPASPLLPFSHLHKYTGESSNPTTYYEIYVVDESGDELRYDGNAAPPAGFLARFATAITTDYSEPKAKSAAEYLLKRAIAYRQRIEDGRGVAPHVDFPPHALGDSWDEKTLARHGEFVALRIYRVELRYAESGLSVESRDRTLAARLTPDGEFLRNGTAR